MCSSFGYVFLFLFPNTSLLLKGGYVVTDCMICREAMTFGYNKLVLHPSPFGMHFFSSFLGEWPGKLGLASGEWASSVFHKPRAKSQVEIRSQVFVFVFHLQTKHPWIVAPQSPFGCEKLVSPWAIPPKMTYFISCVSLVNILTKLDSLTPGIYCGRLPASFLRDLFLLFLIMCVEGCVYLSVGACRGHGHQEVMGRRRSWVSGGHPGARVAGACESRNVGMLRTELRSSSRAVRALYHWDISAALLTLCQLELSLRFTTNSHQTATRMPN